MADPNYEKQGTGFDPHASGHELQGRASAPEKPKAQPRGSMVEAPCESCGTIFTARVSDRARGWGRFCSKACSKAKPTKEAQPMAKTTSDRARDGYNEIASARSSAVPRDITLAVGILMGAGHPESAGAVIALWERWANLDQDADLVPDKLFQMIGVDRG